MATEIVEVFCHLSYVMNKRYQFRYLLAMSSLEKLMFTSKLYRIYHDDKRKQIKNGVCVCVCEDMFAYTL